MTAWNPRANDLFLRALELPATGERQEFLESACAGDATLRAEVDSLLDASAQAGRFLESPAVTPNLAADLDEPPITEMPGTVIGPFKLLELIGEGGFGVVFLAEQQQPVRRKVALKVLKPGMDTRQVVARFEAERQALAMMDHPNIATVHDGGTTPSGRPYFVMELVQGVPITEFCDQKNLTPRQRLQLFIPVCQAVQHAHQKGIIHRDLKPSNVIVSRHDTTPVPKVIDFGVAKAIRGPEGLTPRLTEETLHTGFGAVVGTVEYMSPEQAALDRLDVDTRTDIYSLGVLLYELLAGSPPFSRKETEAVGFLETLRVIREQEPPKPSTKLSSSDALPALSANRGMEPAKLTRLVRGELDWIVMKALEKDRTRRYETANDFARDVQRYLSDEPVQACPPSVGYRLKKLARRHRTALATATGFVALLAGAVVVSAGLAVQATRAERQAQDARRAALQAVNHYFTRVSERLLDPAMEGLRQQLLQDALDYYREFVRTHGDDPDVQAELAAAHYRIAVLTHNLGPAEDWLPPFQNFVDIMEPLVRRRPDVSAYGSLQDGIFRVGAPQLFHVRQPDKALRAMQKAIGLWAELVREYPTVPGFRNDLAAFHFVSSYLLDYAGRLEEARHNAWVASQLWRRLMHENPDEPHYRAALAMSLSSLSAGLADLDRFDEAQAVCREALETASGLPRDVAAWQVLTVTIHQHRTGLFGRAGRLSEALDSSRKVAVLQENLLKDYPKVERFGFERLRNRMSVGGLLWRLDRPTEAAQEFHRFCDLSDQLHLRDFETQRLRAHFLANCADPAFRDPRRAIALAEAIVAEVPESGSAKMILGAARYRAGDYHDAIPPLKEATQLFDRFGAGMARFFLAMAHWQLEQKAEARQWYHEAIARQADLRLSSPIEIARMREEAEALLGIKGGPGAKTQRPDG